MRISFVVILLLALGGCSKVLRVEFFNGTGKTFSVCSIDERGAECATVPAQSTAALQWKVGKFKISSMECVVHYALRTPDPIQNYVGLKNPNVKARVEPDWQVFLTPHQIDGFSSKVEQPQGYPAAPSSIQGRCQ